MVESLFVLFSSAFFGYSFSDFVISKKARRWHHIGNKKGYHLHNSIYGVALFVASPLLLSNLLEIIGVIGFGLGIILEHTIACSFVFITKLQKDFEEEALSVQYEES